MSIRHLAPAAVLAVSAVVSVAAGTGTAHAAPATETVDRSLFDATPERTTSTLHLDGPTAGELGGAMDLVVEAADGTLPDVKGSCEKVRVTAVVTVSPGKVLRVRTRGEGCAHIVDGSLQVNAFFKARNVRYEGFPERTRLVGDGLIAAAHGWLGGQASFFGMFRSCGRPS